MQGEARWGKAFKRSNRELFSLAKGTRDLDLATHGATVTHVSSCTVRRELGGRQDGSESVIFLPGLASKIWASDKAGGAAERCRI